MCYIYGWEDIFRKRVLEKYCSHRSNCYYIAKSIFLKLLLKLPFLMKNVLVDEEAEMYENDCRRLFVDLNLPDVLRNDKPVRGDNWWWQLNEKYPVLSKLSLAALTVFHGPRVESSFSVMGDVMDKKSGRMNVSAYSAIQTVKYSWAAKASKISKKQKVFKYFTWKQI